jgi:hypothetical protein
VSAAIWSADLAGTAAADLRDVRGRPLSDQGPPFTPLEPKPLPIQADAREARVTLEPLGAWRIGSGYASRTAGRRPPAPPGATPPERDREPDALPLREPQIRWSGGRGTVVDAETAGCLIPGASVKGMLLHRALFHFNRRRGRFAEDGIDGFHEPPEALERIFGRARDATGSVEGGLAGRLFIDDQVVETADAQMMAFDHNSIDRFTGGVRNRLLFSEEAVTGGRIELQLRLLPPRDGRPYEDDAVAALEDAVEDLCKGRLALGAKSLGFCDGQAVWTPPREKAP